MDSYLSRNLLLIGADSQQILSSSHVAIFGLGGVGSFVADSLARAGIGKLTIIDFDLIEESNINRQNIAYIDTVGKLKTDVAYEQIKRISSNIEVRQKQVFFSDNNCSEIFKDGFSAVVDAIDSVQSKILLLNTCLDMQIPVYSAMGAGGKLDPSKIKTGTLADTRVCPLAKKMRKALRQHNLKNIKVVYSLEEYNKQIIDQELAQSFVAKNKKIPQGSISYIPAIFGLMLSGLLIQDLILSNASSEKSSKSV